MDFESATIGNVERRITTADRAGESLEHGARVLQTALGEPAQSAAERLWFNKEMKQTKPAQAMELRSLSPVLGVNP